MKEKTTPLELVLSFLLGRKYWANIVVTRGTDRYDMCSYIFRTKADADYHRRKVENGQSFRVVETVSFRSRNEY